MTKKELIYEGKAKTLFFYDDDKIIQYFKDDATAFNKKKHEIINEKGILNNLISEFIFKYLSENGVENHFIERLNDREQLVKKVDIIPVEVIIRNIATGTLTKRLGIQEGLKLKKPLIEFTLKSDELDDPIISEEHIDVLEYAEKDEIKDIKEQALLINKLLLQLFSSINIQLVDFKIEFGRLTIDKTVILADEISPDSCRLWDKSSSEKLDKDRFRKNLGGLIDAYKEVATRLGIKIQL
ncbi:MAG: phosphoribosylaminoimidazolesuccinocarboxamide synthase [Alphaproteobacteria bacterium]